MSLLDCGHDATGEARRVCRHLLGGGEDDYVHRFTGTGQTFDLVCGACGRAADGAAGELRTVCPRCFEEAREAGTWEGIVGRPEVRERESGLSFQHTTVTLANLVRDPILDVQP